MSDLVIDKFKVTFETEISLKKEDGEYWVFVGNQKTKRINTIKTDDGNCIHVVENQHGRNIYYHSLSRAFEACIITFNIGVKGSSNGVGVSGTIGEAKNTPNITVSL